MPKSLDSGPSRKIEIKTSDAERAALIAVLVEGETISELTRELWRKEVARRVKRVNQKPPS